MTGTLFGLGVGPGEPELLTLKAHRILSAAKIIAYPAPDTGPSFAREIVADYIQPGVHEIPIIIPMTKTRFPAEEVYDQAAKIIAAHLDQGNDVAVLCEGDPFFYGSFMYLYARLSHRYSVEVVPGVSSLMACAAAFGRPLAARNDVLTVIPAPLEYDRIKHQLENTDAAAIIKIGRHFDKVFSLLRELNLLERSGYVERASLHAQKIFRLSETDINKAPYFSMILVYRGGEAWMK